MNEPILNIKQVYKSYRYDHTRQEILHGIDLTIEHGEFIALMGPSGCGKSTLLHILGLMLSADEAESFTIDGVNAMPLSQTQRTTLRRDKIGFVFQRFNLLDILTARDNLKLAFKIRGGCINDELIDEALDRVGIANKADRKPRQMSIGEQQRLAIARAIIHSPALLLADEPTGNLDTDNADHVISLLRACNEEQKQTILMVTHNPELAQRADRVICMKDGRLAR